MYVCYKSHTSVEHFGKQLSGSKLVYWTNKKYLRLRVHHYSMWRRLRFMISVLYFQFHKRTSISSSELEFWCMNGVHRVVLMNECRPRRDVWRVFHLFSTSNLLCCVSSKQRFNIIGVHSFLSWYFSFISLPFSAGFFPVMKKFPTDFISITDHGPYFDLYVRK